MNIEPETRNGYFISTTQKMMWSVQMNLLSKLLEVCEIYNLKIWAEGGTLLGAVREKGFIPWDDDIDMAMLRDDYNKLLEIAPDVFKSPYFFQCGYTEDKYPRGHAQLRMDHTTAIGKDDVMHDTHLGIFIDIFVYDELPDNPIERVKFLSQIGYLRDKLFQICYGRYPYMHPMKWMKLLWYRIETHIKGYRNVFKEFDQQLQKHKGSYVALICFTSNIERFLRAKTLYDKTLYVPFEDITIPIPYGYDTILKTQYGEYMKPVQAPTFHGGFLVVDDQKDFKEYLPTLRKAAKREVRRYRLNQLKKFLLK